MTTNRRDFLKTWVVPFTVSASLACTPASESQKLAQDFIEAYYVRIDLDQAAQLAEAVALEKIQKQKELMQGMAPEASADKPQVSFDLQKALADKPDEASYEYLIRSSGPAHTKVSVDKKVLVKVRLLDGQWKVSVFSEVMTEGVEE